MGLILFRSIFDQIITIFLEYGRVNSAHFIQIIRANEGIDSIGKPTDDDIKV